MKKIGWNGSLAYEIRQPLFVCDIHNTHNKVFILLIPMQFINESTLFVFHNMYIA